MIKISSVADLNNICITKYLDEQSFGNKYMYQAIGFYEYNILRKTPQFFVLMFLNHQMTIFSLEFILFHILVIHLAPCSRCLC